jgi:dihydroxyacetone kinase-like predicted kinase
MPPSRIAVLDGRRLARALVAGARAVSLRREAIDRINVFPVADRDTGSNLAATLERVSAAVAGTRERSLAAVARRAADEALLGARGNSGAIAAQALEGFAEAVRGDERTANLPIIALSALTSPEAIERGRQVGFHDYIAKFDRPGLIAALKEQTANMGEAA